MKRTEIIIETSEIWVIRSSTGALPDWCEECGGVVNMLSPEEAAGVADVKVRTIYQWIEADRIHFSESIEGRLLICICSLMALTNEAG
jgi:hypothetical protein